MRKKRFPIASVFDPKPLLGGAVDVEVKANVGRIELVARTDQKLFLFELKDYPARFALCNLPVVKAGVNFNEQMRNITDWVVEG